MKQEHARALIEALRRPRYEVIPLEGVVDRVAGHVPGDAKLAVTASPRKGIERTLDVAAALAELGYRVVPHVSARLVTDEAHLKDVVQRLSDLGIREAFVIAGDVEEPLGAFASALDLLEAMAGSGHHLDEIGIAGYPESHPVIEDDITIQAMWDKRRYATYIVSQLCFDPKVVAGWVRRVRRRGVEQPIHVGVPGPVEVVRLLRVSSSIGLGESARFIRRHRGWLPHLLRPGGYRPDRLVEGLAETLADPADRVAGFHVYTFNEVERTERWRRALLDRLAATATG
jgi:methylenetetrahydrofolate reductase (NADPH)